MAGGGRKTPATFNVVVNNNGSRFASSMHEIEDDLHNKGINVGE